jgi:hypothetical protein
LGGGPAVTAVGVLLCVCPHNTRTS